MQASLTSGPSRSNKYRSDIDGLRAFAVLAVIGFHAFPGRVPGGFIGVDVFYVISGFLISGIILDDLDSRQFSYRAFYARRIRRLFPALVVVLLTTLALGWFLLLPDEYKNLGRHVVAGIAFVSNFLLLSEVDYFETAAELKPLLHLWSLGIEEQFYLIWPFALAAFWRMPRWGIPLMGLAGIASFILNIFLAGSDATAAFYLPFTRFWELSLGALLAVAARRLELPSNPRGLLAERNVHFARSTASIVGLGLLAAALALLSRDDSYPGWYALMPTLGATLLIAAGPNVWVNKYLLSIRPAVFLGLISYPLYLWHWPLLSFLRISGPFASADGERLSRVAAVFLAVLLSYLTFRFVEQPVRKPPFKHTKRVIAAYVLIGMSGLLVFVAVGFPIRTDLASNPFHWDGKRVKTPECLSKYKLAVLGRDIMCVESTPGAEPRTLLLGDSHANHWLPGVESSSNVPILHLAAGGCPPLDKVRSFHRRKDEERKNTCPRFMATAFEMIKLRHSIDTVVLADRGAFYISGKEFGNSPYETALDWIMESSFYPGQSGEELYSKLLAETLGKLAAQRLKVKLVLQVPELGFHPRECVRLLPIDTFKNLRQPCAVPRASVEQRQKQYRQAVSAALRRFPSVEVLDPLDVLCDPEWCYAIKDDVALYRDGNHLSVEGSKYVWQHLESLPARRD